MPSSISEGLKTLVGQLEGEQIDTLLAWAKTVVDPSLDPNEPPRDFTHFRRQLSQCVLSHASVKQRSDIFEEIMDDIDFQHVDEVYSLMNFFPFMLLLQKHNFLITHEAIYDFFSACVILDQSTLSLDNTPNRLEFKMLKLFSELHELDFPPTVKINDNPSPKIK